jgi:hypothetical protein
MACIDNTHLFRRNEKLDKEHTLLMVYKAERLYHALGDSKKIFQMLAKLSYESKRLEEVQASLHTQTTKLDPEGEKFVRKRLQLVKRIQSQIANFETQYNIFADEFVFRGRHIKYLLEKEHMQANDCLGFIESLKQTEVFAVSSRVAESAIGSKRIGRKSQKSRSRVSSSSYRESSRSRAMKVGRDPTVAHNIHEDEGGAVLSATQDIQDVDDYHEIEPIQLPNEQMSRTNRVRHASRDQYCLEEDQRQPKHAHKVSKVTSQAHDLAGISQATPDDEVIGDLSPAQHTPRAGY